MAFFISRVFFLALVLLLWLLACVAHPGQLSSTFYAGTCPNLTSIVLSAMASTIARDPRMGASLLRLHFGDCMANSCDGSLLLDDTATFIGEKNTGPNKNSLRGFGVIDAIKGEVEASCGATVSCADILALAARDGVVLLGGPSWKVKFGRRDSTPTASQQAPGNVNLTGIPNLISVFAAKGLTAQDMTALLGSHTIGFARCVTFRSRLYNDKDINSAFAAKLKKTCPPSGGGDDDNLAPLDLGTPLKFDNQYFKNLVMQEGLVSIDQELFAKGGSQNGLTKKYSKKSSIFFRDFAAAMVKVGKISPLTGSQGQIRLNCRKVN